MLVSLPANFSLVHKYRDERLNSQEDRLPDSPNTKVQAFLVRTARQHGI